MRRHSHIIWFLLASLFVSALVYRDAMWGDSLLAPLDIGPDFFTQYQFMDPSADGIPENHHIIDQFTYDLPLQHAIHSAYRQGEIPWWDPYTYGGRPLLADAHVNGTDPIRLICYRFLPFELAYNWNYIFRGIITGLGMFLLLRTLGVHPVVASILGLTYQFAGWFTLFFGHPWIQGSFLYFPFLWIVWLKMLEGNLGRNVALGGILCGLVFYAGNLQSHTYLPLFALTFLGAVLVKNTRLLPTAIGGCAVSGIIGALLAFPVLSNQVEFYFQSLRVATPGDAWYSHLMAAPVSLCAFYPWSFGTFRTLDAARLIGGGGVGFSLFFGATGAFLAYVGAWSFRTTKGNIGIIVCQALLLVGLYLLIIATPLGKILYSRSACLGGMGLTVLAGLATQAILEGRCKPSPWLVRGFVGLLASVALVTSGLAWFAFPKFKGKIEQKIQNEQTSYSAIPSIAKMRSVQIKNFADEVSLRNPEAAMTLVATVVLGYSLLGGRTTEQRNRLLILSLCLSALPVLIFHARFRPKQPIELWQRMLAGGPAQRDAIQQLQGGLRLDETGLLLSDMIFPNSMAALYRIHAVYGYSALQPPSLLLSKNVTTFSDSWRADLIGVSEKSKVRLLPSSGKSPARFRLVDDDLPAEVRVIHETHNKLSLDITSMARDQSIIRTDTSYPGWGATNGAKFSKIEPCFTKITFSPNLTGNFLTLEYIPSYHRFFLPAILSGIILVGISIFSTRVLRRVQ